MQTCEKYQNSAILLNPQSPCKAMLYPLYHNLRFSITFFRTQLCYLKFPLPDASCNHENLGSVIKESYGTIRKRVRSIMASIPLVNCTIFSDISFRFFFSGVNPFCHLLIDFHHFINLLKFFISISFTVISY